MGNGMTSTLATATEALVLDIEVFVALLMLRIFVNAIHWANLDTLGRLVMPHALGTQGWIDHIDLISLADGAVGAFRLTHIAIDAFVSDD
jgi:hypothetical protein